jgi:UDP-glucose 4-epimerase
MSLRHHHLAAINPQRVVILGASGFIARDLVRTLTVEQIEHRAIGSTEIDLLKPESVAQLQAAVREDDALVITSGLTPDKGRDVATLMKNLTMAEHLAAYLETARCSQVIYISSDAVYDGRENPIRESSPRQATDLYSLMHVAREQIIASTTAKTRTPLCIFCPCAVYGAGDPHNSYGPNRFFRTALPDRKITLFGGGEEIRDHVYIEDVTQLLVLCLRHCTAGTLNAVSGQSVAFREVAEQVANLCGSDVRIECLARGGPITHRHFDATERLRAFPAFHPTPLSAGLAATHRRLIQAQS